MNRIRALLVDDHASFAEGVARTLNAEPDFEVCYCTTLSAALETLLQIFFADAGDGHDCVL